MRRIAALLLACALLLPACTQGRDVLRLGVNLELTGRLAWYGDATLKGVKLAVQEVNAAGGIRGKPIELTVLDNRSENAEAALAAIRLAEREGVLAIIGPSTSGGVKASLAANCGVPILVPSATADDLAPANGQRNDMYRICYTDTMQGRAIARFARQNGIKTAAILTEASSDYSRGMSQVFDKTFTDLGGTVTAQEYYASGETDFCTALTKLKARPFDALFLPGYYTEAALVIRQMHELGIGAAILSGDAFDVPELNELVGSGDYLSDIYFTDHYAPAGGEHTAFARSYRNAYGEEAPAYAALGYDCVKLFALAVQKTEGETRTEVAQQLSYTTDYKGVTGVITIDERHNAQKAVHIIGMQNGVRSEAAVIDPV